MRLNHEGRGGLCFLAVIARHARWNDVACRMISALGQRYNMILRQNIRHDAAVGTAAKVGLFHCGPLGTREITNSGTTLEGTTLFCCIPSVFNAKMGSRLSIGQHPPAIRSVMVSCFVRVKDVKAPLGLGVSCSHGGCASMPLPVGRTACFALALMASAKLVEAGKVFLGAAFRALFPPFSHSQILARGLVNA